MIIKSTPLWKSSDVKLVGKYLVIVVTVEGTSNALIFMRNKSLVKIVESTLRIRDTLENITRCVWLGLILTHNFKVSHSISVSAFKEYLSNGKPLYVRTGERSFLCQVCGKNFTSTSNANRHIREQHFKISRPRQEPPNMNLPSLLLDPNVVHSDH